MLVPPVTPAPTDDSRRQALMALELVTPGLYGGSYLDLPYTATRPAEVTPERFHVGVDATLSTVSVGTPVRPSAIHSLHN